jgi:TetR/AcrR family transcriptional regulator, fatty acid metabolism regulator protein
MELSIRQQEIVDTSIGLIADRGIQNLTMKNISTAVGISEPAIYRHFRNKFDIIEAVLDAFSLIASNVLNSPEMAKCSTLEKIELFLLDRYRRCAAHPEMAKVMMAEENFQADEVLATRMLKMMHQHKEQIEGFITAGMANGEIRDDIDPTIMFRIIFGPMRLLIKQWGLSGYKFDLAAEGKALWEAEKKMISI